MKKTVTTVVTEYDVDGSPVKIVTTVDEYEPGDEFPADYETKEGNQSAGNGKTFYINVTNPFPQGPLA